MPLIKRDTSANTDGFIDVAGAESVYEGRITTVAIHKRKIILTRHEDHVIAIDSVCPHAAADLSKGSLRSWQICCHEHDYCFDIRNGRIVWPEDEVYRLRRFEVKEEGGRVLVRLAAG
jgi:nitrite reductase/ring-hydroxylating ferredoxin subunit